MVASSKSPVRVVGEREHAGQRRGLERLDREAVAQAAVELDLRDRAHAEAEAERADAPQIAAQARGRIETSCAIVEAGLEQDVARRHGFRILGDERTRLRRTRADASARPAASTSGPRAIQSHDDSPSMRLVRTARRLSSRIVTGPSLTSSTCMCAWNTPVSTGRPSPAAARPASYSVLATSGGAAASNAGRRPFRTSPSSVNCETTRTAPPASTPIDSSGRRRPRRCAGRESSTRCSRYRPGRRPPPPRPAPAGPGQSGRRSRSIDGDGRGRDALDDGAQGEPRVRRRRVSPADANRGQTPTSSQRLG